MAGSKVGRVFRMVILSEFRMGQYIDDDHREDTPHFTREWSQIDFNFHNVKIFDTDSKSEILNQSDDHLCYFAITYAMLAYCR